MGPSRQGDSQRRSAAKVSCTFFPVVRECSAGRSSTVERDRRSCAGALHGLIGSGVGNDRRCGTKLFYPVIAGVSNVNISKGISCYILWTAELPIATSGTAKGFEECAACCETLDAVIAGVSHKHGA